MKQAPLRLGRAPLGTRKVLVTGGGSGIGLAIAQLLLERGGQVVASGRRRSLLTALAKEHPGKAVALPADLRLPAEQRTLVRRAKKALNGLDGLVCSAGMIIHGKPGRIRERDLREQLEVNLIAPIRLAEQALDELEPGGAILFLSSTLAQRPVETSCVYSAAKAGLLAAMRSLAIAGAKRRVRVNAICPGVVDTDLIRRGKGLSEPWGKRRSHLERLHPLGLGRPSDIATAGYELLANRWATGTELILDGGLSL